MAKIIDTGRGIKLTPEDEAHLQAVAAVHDWDEVEDIHIHTPVVQPPLSPELEAHIIKRLTERGLLDQKHAS